MSRDAAPAPRLTLGQSRRAGLGAPVGTVGGSDAAAPDTAAATPAQARAPLPAVAQRQVGLSAQRQPSPAAPSQATVQSSAGSAAATTVTPAPNAASASGSAPTLGSSPTMARSVGSIGATPVKPVQRTRIGLGEPLDLAARPVSRQAAPPAADNPFAPASPASADSANAVAAGSADAPLLGGMSTQTMAMPTVSRLADGDSDEAGDLTGGGSSAPLTLRHDHASAEPSEEQTPAPPTAATASFSAGGDAGHGAAVVARPVSVARLVDAGSTTNVGGLVGTHSLLQRNVQRSVDGGPRTARTQQPAVGVGPVRPLANSSATAASPTVGATPGTASSIGDFASAVSAAGSAESAPPFFALSARKPPTVVGCQPAGRQSAGPARRGPAAAGARATAGAHPRTVTGLHRSDAMAVAQRAIDARAEDAPPPVAPVQLQAPVQRAVTIDEVSTEAGSTGSAAGASSATPQSPAELEQLATKLWGRLRLQLRRELLADRERAGMLTDLH